MFENSEKALKKLKTVSLDYLLLKHKRYACICKANMCGSCLSFEQGGLQEMKDALNRNKIPFSVRECRDNPENYALLMSTGTSKVPCVIYISNGTFQVKSVEEFQEFLKNKF